MQFDSRKERRRIFNNKGSDVCRKTCDEDDPLAYYDHNLQFYGQPPTETIALMEFEDLALERLKVLKAVESARERFKTTSDEFSEAMIRELSPIFSIACTATVPNVKLDAAKEYEIRMNRRRDHIGHFILRLAFCRSPELSKWFMAQEMELFRYRFAIESKSSIDRFLQLSGFHMDTLDMDEKNALLPQLSAGSGLSTDQVLSSDFWKVPFTDALELVRKRRVFLKNGQAFVPRSDLIVIIAGKFRKNMSFAMAKASKYFAYIEEEDRLGPFLRRLSNKAYVGKDYTNAGENNARVTPEMVEGLASTSFPLCMRRLHAHLRKEHHMRHFGRMQYGLFLKGIGMTLEDALKFWKLEFTKKIDSDQFEKQYAYNIRHNYGKEGKRTDYTPYHCAKIILGNPPGSQDAHGCPFKHTDPDLLAQQLESMTISKDQINKIVGFARVSQYDRACTRFFEITHKMPEEALGQLITHPNQYYEESRKIITGKRSIEAVKTVNVTVYDKPAVALSQEMDDIQD
uniref:DNA primase large subunit n=1 Tax=Plectus sambesii TaxID=2011161 RepID=A0A914XBG7_9BILA